jgi:predicted nucleic acid-binding protein
VKRYLQEEGGEKVRPLFRRRVAASAISGVEVPAALWRRAREGDLPEARAKNLVKRVVEDLSEMIVVEVRRSATDLARQLVERRPLRAYDAVQLACALLLAERTETAVTFVCADHRLCEVAVAEQLRSMKVG